MTTGSVSYRRLVNILSPFLCNPFSRRVVLLLESRRSAEAAEAAARSNEGRRSVEVAARLNEAAPRQKESAGWRGRGVGGP